MAAQVLNDLMLGLVKDADGNTPPSSELAQRRLSANSILDRVGVVVGGPPNELEDDEDSPVIGIKVYTVSSEEDENNDQSDI